MSWWTGDIKWREAPPGTPKHRVCQVSGCGVFLTLMREQHTELLVHVCPRCGDWKYVNQEHADKVLKEREYEWDERESLFFRTNT